MKLLWHSVHPLIPTGYGTQTRIVCNALKRQGIDVVISCSVGLFHHSITVDGITVLPHTNMVQNHGNDSVEEHFRRMKCDMVMSFLDAFAVAPNVARALPWAVWAPIDSSPVMEHNEKTLEAAKVLVACSRFGEEQMRAFLIDKGLKDKPLYYMPCVYDAKQYSIYDTPDPVRDARKVMGKALGREIGPEVFLVNVVSANVGARKNFPALFKAWGEYVNEPGLLSPRGMTPLLYVHSETSGKYQGDNLYSIMKAFCIPKETVIFADQWAMETGQLGPDWLRVVHNASDLHLNVCRGEGFGLPILEALACGCPVAFPAFGAPESEFEFEYRDSSIYLIPGEKVYSVPGALQWEVNHREVLAALTSAESCVEDQRKLKFRRRREEYARQWEVRENEVQMAGQVREMCERMKA